MSVPITPRLYRSSDGTLSTHKPTETSNDDYTEANNSNADSTAQTPLLAESSDGEPQTDSEPYDDIIIATTRRIEDENPDNLTEQHIGSRTTVPVTEDSESVTAETLSYKDMSNSTLTNVVAIIVLSLISGLNFFLIISAAMGADVNFRPSNYIHLI